VSEKFQRDINIAFMNEITQIFSRMNTHVVKSGGRWVDAPACYGPRKTLYNRFVRWAAKGVWQDLFVTLAAAGGPPAEV
jgi:transposase